MSRMTEGGTVTQTAGQRYGMSDEEWASLSEEERNAIITGTPGSGPNQSSAGEVAQGAADFDQWTNAWNQAHSAPFAGGGTSFGPFGHNRGMPSGRPTPPPAPYMETKAGTPGGTPAFAINYTGGQGGQFGAGAPFGGGGVNPFGPSGPMSPGNALGMAVGDPWQTRTGMSGMGGAPMGPRGPAGGGDDGGGGIRDTIGRGTSWLGDKIGWSDMSPEHRAYLTTQGLAAGLGAYSQYQQGRQLDREREEERRRYDEEQERRERAQRARERSFAPFLDAMSRQVGSTNREG